MLGEWYLPPGECQVILPIKKVPFPFPTTLSSPFRQGSLKPRFCKQITHTPRNPPGPRIRRSEGSVFQAAFCLVLYNLLQVIRAYVAASQVDMPVESVSVEQIFLDVQQELTALT